MPPSRASLMMPCSRLDDLPTQLEGEAAAGLLAAWTALWHPALLHATGGLPGWHSADAPPEPDALEAELIVIPSVSRERLPVDWCDRLAATGRRNPPLVEASASRAATLSALFSAAELAPDAVTDELAADFLALGYAHLQVELLTRAMHYTTVLDADEFRGAVMEAARNAVAGDRGAAREGLGRAFDLLADARNHFYAVDFYLVDVTLLAGTTLGESLRTKLAAGPPTSLLVTAETIETIAREHPETLSALLRSIDAERACVVGGPTKGEFLASRAPEGMLADLLANRRKFQEHLQQEPAIYAQFGAAFSPLLPELLTGVGYRGALYCAFAGEPCSRPAQPKTRWGPPGGPTIEVLATRPLDVAEPATWLTLGQRIGQSLARDFVATVLLAGWPGQHHEYYDDLRRIAEFSNVLGKFVTLEDYFRQTAEVDDASNFFVSDYSASSQSLAAADPISSSVRVYRSSVAKTFDDLCAGFTALLEPFVESGRAIDPTSTRHVATRNTACASLNPWNFASPRCAGFEPLDFHSGNDIRDPPDIRYAPEVLGCGFAMFEEALPPPPVPLADGRTLRNEFLELVISEQTGGIQSLRTHRDRSTRVSQRLVLEAQMPSGKATDVASQMIAERIDVTRNDKIVGEVTARGRLVDANGGLIARFVQVVRVFRGLPPAIVQVEIDPQAPFEGDLWENGIASRVAWRDDALGVRQGVDWVARDAKRKRIESPEWVEVTDAFGPITLFGLGLPYHRLVGTSWLDTLLVTAGETGRQFQFALGLNCRYPTPTALALLTAGRSSSTNWLSPSLERQGWFLHVSAGNAVVTHLAPIGSAGAGLRLRILETEGRGSHVVLSAFRPFREARRTDFRGEEAEPLFVVDGRIEFDLGTHRWVQIEAEW